MIADDFHPTSNVQLEFYGCNPRRVVLAHEALTAPIKVPCFGKDKGKVPYDVVRVDFKPSQTN